MVKYCRIDVIRTSTQGEGEGELGGGKVGLMKLDSRLEERGQHGWCGDLPARHCGHRRASMPRGLRADLGLQSHLPRADAISERG